MDTTQKRETYLHYTMSVVGGIFALYSLLEHANVFGSAETSNMILLVNDLLQWDLFHIVIRVGSLLVYAAGITVTLWMSRCCPGVQKRACILIDCAAALVLSLLPQGLHPVVALYPVAFAMSIQWCTFRGVGDDPSATTFSTGNFRQLVTLTFSYALDRRPRELSRIRFYIITMLCFHGGIAFTYLIHPHLTRRSIWTVWPLLLCALAQELALSTQRTAAEQLDESTGCEDV